MPLIDPFVSLDGLTADGKSAAHPPPAVSKDRKKETEMTSYELTINFDSAGLTALSAAGQLVTIVKSVSTGTPVAWIAFEPEELNTITWTEEYSVYASTSNIVNGAQIMTSSTSPAVGGQTYSFVAGQFGVGEPGLPTTEYGVTNSDSAFLINGVQMITSGLYQGAVVNGETTASPLNATPILFNENATFTPVEKIQVFASSYQNNGLVISSVSGTALLVDLTTNPSQTIKYNDGTNQFSF